MSSTSSKGDADASESPVDHLIFVIHGIGQQTEQYGHFYEHIDNLRETTRQVLQSKVPDHAVRIELIPIEWHRHIHDQTDPIMSKITLKSIPTIRLIENEYLADVLFYFSKDRGQNITDNVTNLFNTSYNNFLEKHPDFKGKIAIIGYSLGGVITWDILSHQRQPSSAEEEAEYAKVTNRYSPLDFKPDYFFGFGSPVGAVLTMRNQSPKLYHPDHDIVFENVFHPFDPLAYRFEPLLNEYYTNESAVLVDRSIPLGPTFSFPYMPSFPGTGIFSMFSWKMSSSNQKEPPASTESETRENLPAAAIVAAQSNDKAARKADKKQSNSTQGSSVSDDTQSDDSGNKIISSVSSFFGQYFSNSNSRSTLNEHEENSNQDESDTRPTIKNGIVTWDPLDSESHSELVSRHSSEMSHSARTYEETDIYGSSAPSPTPSLDDLLQEGRPSLRQRSVTYNSPKNLAIEDAMFEGERKRNPKQRHLVEVLGIDGIRVESLERAHEEFDRTSPDIPGNSEGHDELYKAQGDDSRPDASGSTVTTASGGIASHSSNNSEEKHNVWRDLNEELHEPGPGITEPGKSKAEVAQDATHGKKEDEPDGKKQQQAKEQMSEEEKKAEAEKQQRLLPGNRRIDHVLQPESFMSMIANEYIVGLRAHFSYWSNKDLLWHIVRRLENLEIEPKKQEEPNSTAKA
ncbi:DDHD domain-domain-containing protein [Syncephalastrum racemosum]|uniref:DDHD domain-domain-containing protein n=1 Tax=Syncephalastrum racemosum TaxID=13706 RepID=A0A1X2H4Z9_SYNRA|nr:DDHD domain-domain-containing protein [Syncephalastrum racemosum]